MIGKDRLAKMMDMTQLATNACESDLENLAKEAVKCNVYSVCVNPYNVAVMKKKLKGTDIKVCSVVGFPLGADIMEAKEFEAAKCLEHGADELDMVMNVGAFMSGQYDVVKDEISHIAKLCSGKILKVIIEVGMLSDDQIIHASNIVKEAGADFVKTMTGFATTGNTMTKPEQVALIRKTVGENFGVKASGGTRTLENVRNFVNAGASRLGMRVQDVGRIIEEWDE